MEYVEVRMLMGDLQDTPKSPLMLTVFDCETKAPLTFVAHFGYLQARALRASHQWDWDKTRQVYVFEKVPVDYLNQHFAKFGMHCLMGT